MKKAAELGDPNACLHMGKQIFTILTTEALTKKEKAEYKAAASNYISKATDLGSEAEFLLCALHALFQSHTASEW